MVIDGECIGYDLADQEVRLLGGKLRLRQVTRPIAAGHQILRANDAVTLVTFF
jgi:hypothetical protein